MNNEHLWENYNPTARGTEEYFEDLHLNIDDLRDKKILDIGSGLNQFANELREKDPSIDIISLDPFYELSKEERKALYSEKGYEDGDEKLKELLNQLELNEKLSQLVAGRSEALPFINESFDLIISHYGSPFYAENAEKIEQFFSELNRVLKKGGEARVYPTWLHDSDSKKIFAMDKALKDLEERGFHIEKVVGAWVLKKALEN